MPTALALLTQILLYAQMYRPSPRTAERTTSVRPQWKLSPNGNSVLLVPGPHKSNSRVSSRLRLSIMINGH